MDGQTTHEDNTVKAGEEIKIDEQTSKVTDDDLKIKKAADRDERKRLKERLRGSLSLKKVPHEEYKFQWSDYIFGISDSDQRSAKEGSRSRS